MAVFHLITFLQYQVYFQCIYCTYFDVTEKSLNYKLNLEFS